MSCKHTETEKKATKHHSCILLNTTDIYLHGVYNRWSCFDKGLLEWNRMSGSCFYSSQCSSHYIFGSQRHISNGTSPPCSLLSDIEGSIQPCLSMNNFYWILICFFFLLIKVRPLLGDKQKSATNLPAPWAAQNLERGRRWEQIKRLFHLLLKTVQYVLWLSTCGVLDLIFRHT